MENESESSSVYKPLDTHKNEIRVLRLKSRQYNLANNHDEDLIICFLGHAFLSSGAASVEYIALSYVWENGFPPQSIFLSGKKHLISANLADALRELRREFEDLILWADQLCINQNDQAEKGSQVQKMGSIYQKAKQVIAWLGVEGNESELVFTVLHQIETHHTYSSQASIISEILRELEQHDPWIQDHNEIIHILKTALPAFAARTYWSRLWVLQEYVLASNLLIQSGSSTISSSTFKTAWNVLGRAANSRYASNSSPDLIAISSAWRDNSPFWFDAWLGIKRFIAQRDDYHLLLYENRNVNTRFILEHDLFTIMYKTLTTFSGQVQLSCSDPRDRIFSLLGLATDVNEFGHFPNYTTSPEHIFEEVARNFLQKGHVDIFSFCQENPDSRKRPDLASWAADWSLKIRIPLWGKVLVNVTNGWDVELAPSFSGDRKAVTVNGTCIGQIESVGSQYPHTKPLTLRQTQIFLHQLRSFCDRSPLIPVDEEEGICAALAAPSALPTLGGDKELMLFHYRAMFEQMWYIEEEEQEQEEGEEIQFRSPYERELRLQFLRCPFLTGNGYVGLGAPWVKDGDLVVVFPGGRVPYVVREVVGTRGCRVVGEAFVNGVMNGEFFERERKVREFVLV